MNRKHYFDAIEERLSILATRVNSRGKLNILDLHLHSEMFYQHLLNELYGWDTVNVNTKNINVEAIDLIDNRHQLLVQVSATCTKQKIENSLSKKSLSSYKNYSFKFVAISNDSNSLKKVTFKNPFSINFIPETDIIDIKSILSTLNSLKTDDLERVYLFIKKELNNNYDTVKTESNLAHIISVLSKEDWDKSSAITDEITYEIERKIRYNNLKVARRLIDEYSSYYGKLNKIYNEYDLLGNNKSKSVLSAIHTMYIVASKTVSDDELFFEVWEKVIERITNSLNYVQLPREELELCVNILVVDAFIRCKIFEKPGNYYNATT